jgi:hypothetical protein
LESAKQAFPNEKVFPITFVNRAKYRSQWHRALKQHLEPSSTPAPWPPRSRYAQ